MRRKLLVLSFTIMAFISMSVVTFATEIDAATQNADIFRWWTVLPPLIAIILAFITKNVVISLFIGVITGTYLISLTQYGAFKSFSNSFLLFIEQALHSLADPWNAGIVLQVLTIGGLIALVSKMGGAKAVAQALSAKAKSPKSAQIITWLLGLLVFFDDYANSLIVGPIMRPVTDKMKISREKLAFIVDATAAPVAGIAVISTWIGYELSTIKAGYAQLGMEVSPFNIFLQTIPYRFYNLLMLLFILFTVIFLREFGPMLKAERRARETGKVLSDTAMPMVSDEMSELEPNPNIKLSIWNAIIPIGTLIVAAFIGFYTNGRSAILSGEDMALIELMQSKPFSTSGIIEAFGASDASIVLFQAALIASIVAIIMGLVQKHWTLQESIDIWIQGMKSLIITGVILILAWSLSSVIKELGTAKFLVSTLSGSINPILLPSIIFILGSIISFATGTSYGTMGILMPLAIPFAFEMNNPDPNYIIICISAVLSGAIFGDHCSPISDTTILSSMGAACDHIDHVKTQIWYSIAIGIITIIFGYIPAAMGVPVYITLLLSIGAVLAVTFIIGKPIEPNATGENTLKSK